MTRLIDKALRDPRFAIPPWWNREPQVIGDVMARFLAFLEKAEVIVADNVSEYLYAETPQENWHERDFPCVAPPFETFWIEWRRPSRVISEVYGEVPVDDSVARETGWLFQAHSRDDGGWRMEGMPLLVYPDLVPDLTDREIFFAAAYIIVDVAPDGSIEYWDVAALKPDSVDENHYRSLSTWATAVSSMSHVAFLALCFLNCKNVVVERQDPPPKLSRRHEKRKGRPLTSYRTLQIDPMRKVLRSEGGSEEKGLATALHICRGHFKSFSEDRKLFGKHTGTYWWGPQLRGDREQGAVVKTYNVKAGSR